MSISPHFLNRLAETLGCPLSDVRVVQVRA